jgi:hypothetical protein
MRWRPQRRLGALLATVLLFSALVFSAERPEATLNPARRGTFTPQGRPPAGAEVVRIGFYPVSVYNLDLASNTFYGDAYV